MHYYVRKYFHNQESEGISYLQDVKPNWHISARGNFKEKREASLYEAMQRLPEETRDLGDCLQRGGGEREHRAITVTTWVTVQDPDDAGDIVAPRMESEGGKRETKDSLDMREDVIIRGESETTEYDFSTDDESLRWEAQPCLTRWIGSNSILHINKGHTKALSSKWICLFVLDQSII